MITFINPHRILAFMRGGSIKGTVVSGLGEGSYFMAMPHYNKAITEKLGFSPFPGTLNIKTGKIELDNNKKITINGFEKNGKKFGGVSCWKARIGKISGAIIIPEINKHKDILEFIAPVSVKSSLGTKDGDIISVEFI